jgi:hypothetical protein
MATTYDVKADWRNVDPDSLTDDLQLAYEAYREANRTAQAAREAFETSFCSAVPCPRGQRLAFGYRFGKLSIAVIPDDRPATKPAKAPFSLADLIRSQQRSI